MRLLRGLLPSQVCSGREDGQFNSTLALLSTLSLDSDIKVYCFWQRVLRGIAIELTTYLTPDQLNASRYPAY